VATCAECGVDGCRALYDELSVWTLSLGDAEFIHQLIVDAYAAQHAEDQSKPVRVTFALVGLYLVNEHGYTGRQAQRAHVLLARRSKRWPRFRVPEARAAMTVRDAAAASLEDRPAAIKRWSAAVWASWQEAHKAVAALTIGQLGWV
jgi:hypothetical protein